MGGAGPDHGGRRGSQAELETQARERAELAIRAKALADAVPAALARLAERQAAYRASRNETC